MTELSLAVSTDDGTVDVGHLDVLEGDCVSLLEGFPSESVHAVVTDPPYNYDGGFMSEDWDDIGSPTEYQEWCESWAAACKRVLKPGGHLIAFSSNTAHHRLMAGVEDAGYEIRDTITWHYGEGVPKGPQLSTWLDGEDAEQWGDWRGLLKPATEFAVLARSPLDGSSTQNQVKHGVGNLNVEAVRIGDTPRVTEGLWTNPRLYSDIDPDPESDKEVAGRYPPNVALDPVMAELMDLQSGDVGRNDSGGPISDDSLSGNGRTAGDGGYYDSGGASRFFYCSKASLSERTHDGAVENDHVTVKPIDLMEWLIKLVTAEGQTVVDPFVGSGTTLLAGENANRNVVGIDADPESVRTAERRVEEHVNGQTTLT